MHILKFGGTSVATDERRAALAGIVARASQRHAVWVVVSALAGITDLLTTAIDDAIQTGTEPAETLAILRARHPSAAAHAMIGELSTWLRGVAALGECGPRTRGRILALGERLAVVIVADALTRRGLSVHPIDATDLIAVEGDLDETTVAINWATTERRTRRQRRRVPDGHVVLVPGFIAADRQRHVRTLGRGASDLSATILARALAAERVEIWTDVAGVMSADPRRVPDATPLDRLDYGTAATLARFGAAVLHPETIAPLTTAGIPLVIRDTRSPHGPGTVVSDARSVQQQPVRAVSTLTRLARLTVPATPNSTSVVGVRALLAAVGLPVVHLQHTARHVAITLSATHADRARRSLQRGCGGVVGHESGLALVAAVAAGGAPDLASLGHLMAALEQSGLAPRAVTFPDDDDEPFALVILVNEDAADRATRVVHRAWVQSGGHAHAHRTVRFPYAETARVDDHAHVGGSPRLG